MTPGCVLAGLLVAGVLAGVFWIERKFGKQERELQRNLERIEK